MSAENKVTVSCPEASDAVKPDSMAAAAASASDDAECDETPPDADADADTARLSANAAVLQQSPTPAESGIVCHHFLECIMQV